MTPWAPGGAKKDKAQIWGWAWWFRMRNGGDKHLSQYCGNKYRVLLASNMICWTISSWRGKQSNYHFRSVCNQHHPTSSTRGHQDKIDKSTWTLITFIYILYSVSIFGSDRSSRSLNVCLSVRHGHRVLIFLAQVTLSKLLGLTYI